MGTKIVMNDGFLQQILNGSADYDVVATMNLNGDYISNPLAARCPVSKYARMMFEDGITASISKKIVTYDFAGLMDNAFEVSNAKSGDAVIGNVC